MMLRPVGSLLTRALLTVGLTALCSSAAFAAPRVSQASLNLDTCGCPTAFNGPTCREESGWELTKTADTNELDNPSNELVTYSITVQQSPTETNLAGSGQIIITNSGSQTAFLSGLVLNLEESCGGCGNSIGPSGRNWKIWRTGAQVRGSSCQQNFRSGYGIVNSCYGSSADDGSATIVLTQADGIDLDSDDDVIAFASMPGIPATSDNDGDGRRDEDGKCGQPGSLLGVDDDGDGRVDEDGSCEDAVIYDFTYSYDIRDLVEDGSIQAGDAMRINLMVTFGGAGDRGNGGASCAIDIDCDGIEDCDDPLSLLTDEWEGDWGPACGNRRGDNVRTVQQRGNFTMPPCESFCDTVEFQDDGAVSVDDCLLIENAWDGTDPNGTLYAVEDGQSLDFELDTTVSCACGDNMGELESQLSEAEGPDGLVTIQCTHPGAAGAIPSYWDCTISGSADSDLNRLYDAWCVDIDMTLGGGTYQAQLVSSYSPEALQFVEFPQNLPNVNYMLNQPSLKVGSHVPNSAGCGSTAGFDASEKITYGDVERATWAMVEEENSTNGLGAYSTCRVNYLVKQACGVDNVEGLPGDVVGASCPPSAIGSSYEPNCGAIVGVMIVPMSGGAVAGQVNLLQMPMNLVLDDGCYACTESCDTSLVNTASLTCSENQSLVTGSPATVRFDVTCQGVGPGSILPGDFCSYTQGGWGQGCNGNNAGCLRDANFFGVFGATGLLIGTQEIPDGNNTAGDRTARWITASAIEAYLPGGGPAKPLDKDLINPTKTASGNLGSQLVAATLNVRFDDAGVRKPNNAPKPDGVGSMRSLIYRGCVDTKLMNKTIDQVLAIANDVIDGSTSEANPGITPQMLVQALTVINEQFDECELKDFMCFENPNAPIR